MGQIFRMQPRSFLRMLALLAIAFSLLYFLVGEDGAPGGSMFALLSIFVAASVSGTLVANLNLNLPPLLGMLISGLLLRNLPFVGSRVGGMVDPQWSSVVRTLALTLILVRAGLGLDMVALGRLRFVVARLAVLPCVCEALTIAGLAAVLLDFPAAWALMLGFLVAAISPAVVVPSVLSLQDQGYGAATGIPPMVVAAAALDDVCAIAGFGICMGFAIEGSSDTPRWLQIARAPLEIVLGIAAGALGTVLIMALLPSDAVTPLPHAEENRAIHNWRVAMLAGFAALAFFGFKRAGFSGASALTVLVLSAGCARGWGSAAARHAAASLTLVWNRLAQPLLFGLVGAAVSLDELEAGMVSTGLLLLVCSLSVRCTVAYCAVCGRGLRWQERLFTALAWLPKATVQAALGAVALREATSEREEQMGREVLAVAVLSILFTAPAGATIISVVGPRLLLLDGAPGKASVKEGVQEIRIEAFVPDVGETDSGVVVKASVLPVVG